MRIPAPYSKRKARIEIIPLIDIVFFLLATFVMVSLSMIKNQAIPVHLPVATTSASEDRKDAVSLSVTEDGSLYIDKDLISMDELPQRLSQLKSGEPGLKVFIHGDEKASFGAAIQVLDEVRKQGITKVAIQTLSPSAAEGAPAPMRLDRKTAAKLEVSLPAAPGKPVVSGAAGFLQSPEPEAKGIPARGFMPRAGGRAKRGPLTEKSEAKA